MSGKNAYSILCQIYMYYHILWYGSSWICTLVKYWIKKLAFHIRIVLCICSADVILMLFWEKYRFFSRHGVCSWWLHSSSGINSNLFWVECGSMKFLFQGKLTWTFYPGIFHRGWSCFLSSGSILVHLSDLHWMLLLCRTVGYLVTRLRPLVGSSRTQHLPVQLLLWLLLRIIVHLVHCQWCTASRHHPPSLTIDMVDTSLERLPVLWRRRSTNNCGS